MKESSKFPVRKQVIHAFASITIILLLMVTMIVFHLSELEDATLSARKQTEMLALIAELNKNVGLIQIAVLRHVVDIDKDAMARQEMQIQRVHDSNSYLIGEIEIAMDDELQQKLIQNIRLHRGRYVELREEVIQLSRGRKDKEAYLFNVSKVRPAYDGYLRAIAQLADSVASGAKSAAKDHKTLLDRTFTYSNALAVIGILLAGIMSIVITRVARRLKEDNERLTSEIAERRRVEQEREQLIVRLTETNEDLHALDHVTDNAASTLNLNQVLRVLLERLVEVMKADIAVVKFKEGEHIRVRASVGMDDEVRAGYTVPIGQDFTGLIAYTMRPLYIANAQTDPRVLNPFVKKQGIQAMLGVPMKRNGNLVGTLHVAWFGPHPRREREVHLLEITAERCAMSIVNAQLFEAQKHSEERYRLLFERNPQPMWVYDLETLAFLAVNDAAVRSYQYARDEFLSMTIRDIRPPEDVPALLENVHRGASEYEHSGFWRHKKKDGTLIDVEIVSHSLDFDERKARLVLAIDVTARVRAERDLRQSEERYRSLVESARDVIFTISPHGVITSLNSAFETLTGWKREAWMGKSVTDLLHRDDLTSATTMIANVLSGKGGGVNELRVRKNSGDYLIGEFSTTPQIQSGKTVGLLGMVRDVTEKKQLEQQLIQVQKMESIGTLAGGIAHDFNNILGIILGHTSLIEYGKDDPNAVATGVKTISQAVRRGSDLVRQILTFARKADVGLETVNINSAIEELSRMLRGTFPKTIGIQLHLVEDMPRIRMDPGQFHQALLNLCVNARDAMTDPQQVQSAPGLLTIRTELVDGMAVRKRFGDAREASYVCLSITDTGRGMDEQTKLRIFEPFFTTKGSGKGTGLGLSVVYGVIHNHGGFVDVESQVGRGTTFKLYLPVPQQPLGVGEADRSREMEAPGGAETLLLIEDEESLRDLTKLMLERKGYKVLTAEDGIEAIKTYTEHKSEIALVLTDIGLPKLDGATVLVALRDINPNVKAIVASGYIEPGLRSELLEAGAKEFVQKPYVPGEVLNKVRQVIDM